MIADELWNSFNGLNPVGCPSHKFGNLLKASIRRTHVWSWCIREAIPRVQKSLMPWWYPGTKGMNEQLPHSHTHNAFSFHFHSSFTMNSLRFHMKLYVDGGDKIQGGAQNSPSSCSSGEDKGRVLMPRRAVYPAGEVTGQGVYNILRDFQLNYRYI